MKEQLSAAKFLNLKGDKYASRRNPVVHSLPCIGDIILYNEIIKDHRNGSPGYEARRGVGKVLAYTSCLMVVEIQLSINCKTVESFLINDMKMGLLSWCQLSSIISINQYTYNQLDIKHPHPDIKSRIA